MDFEIFILTRNRLPMLKQALDSALRQTVAVRRITVMDNASEDGTEDYVRSVAAEHGCVSLSRKASPVDVSANMKTAVDMAVSDYFTVMHDDDILSPSYAEAVGAVVKEVPSATMISVAQRIFGGEDHDFSDCASDIDFEVYDNGADFAIGDFIRFLSDQSGSVCFPAVVYSRDSVSRIGLDMSRFGKICDKPFVYDSMGAGPVVRILKPLYNYRLHGGQDSSCSMNGPYPDEILNLLEKQRKLFSSDAAHQKIFDSLSVLWMKSLYFWGRNPKSEWRKFFRMAKDRGLVRGFLSKPWKHWLWRALTNRKVSGFQKSRMPAVEHIALKGEEP